MAENSNIAWTHHTFNPWRGCARVSPGCINCYAETLSKRNPKTLGTWGVDGVRGVASESYWKQPLRWDREAARLGERHRVFCASLADVGEDRADLVEPRKRLQTLIWKTPNLDWLLLTKRPENLTALFHREVLELCWVGVTAENQEYADKRIPILLDTPAAVRFVSYEPALGPVNFDAYMDRGYESNGPAGWVSLPSIDWLISGGESGGKRRDPGVDVLVSAARQGVAAGVAVFVKQDVALHPGQQGRIPDDIWALKQFPEVA